MAKEVRLPKFGDTMEEGTIVDCKVSVGDHVKSGDVLFDVETDKATLEIESPADGYVKQIIAEVGGSYRIETPLLILGDKDERVSDEFLRSLRASTPATPTIAKPKPAKREKISDLPMPIPVLPADIKLGQTIPVSRLQKITSQKMLRSKQEIPCFYLNVRADVTDIVAYRAKLNKTSETEVTYNDFIIKAIARGLEKFPIMTGQIDGDDIELAKAIGVGLAISTPEGLIAPIVKDPDKKTVVEIASYSRQLVERAKNNQLTLEDLEGGCITVSNLGTFGVDSFIPIVVPGQCSILGIGKIADVCVPTDDNPDTLGVHKMMNMTLSVDHKVANGGYAAQFLDFVKKTLEDPANFK
ncbi:MAG: dihydrolipoamide acetyltransferase family protein [Sedimentisphaerales bacterium]|jgi:pyruvate dehydrogenase E2 component (dihydrolipoamide acetyltransferase)